MDHLTRTFLQFHSKIQSTRYSIRRLDDAHCEAIRMSDLRVRQSPLVGTPGAGVDQTEASRRIHHIHKQAPSSALGTSAPALVGNIWRRSSAPEGNAADPITSANSHAAVRQHRSGVQSAPTSNQGGTRRVPPESGDVIRFGIEQEIVPRLLSSGSTPGPSPWPSSSTIQLSSGEGTPSLQQQQQISHTSTLSAPSRRASSGSGSRSALAALRAEREAAEAEVRQAMARATPNIFPEILVAPPTAREAGGSGEGIRGRRGWVAGV